MNISIQFIKEIVLILQLNITHHGNVSSLRSIVIEKAVAGETENNKHSNITLLQRYSVGFLKLNILELKVLNVWGSFIFCYNIDILICF